LLYKASVHGFDVKFFHEKCDNIGPTLILIKANNNIFGGYTDIKWDSSNAYK